MLRDAKLHHKFWEDAVATANYLHNRLPHKGNNKQVPYELLYGQPVDYNKLKVFGCQVYYYIPKQLRKKFNNTTHPGIFIGYDEVNHTAYKIYDSIDNKIILARAVIFFEDEPANIPAPLSNPTYQNFLPYYETGGTVDKNELISEEELMNEIYKCNINLNFDDNNLHHSNINQNINNNTNNLSINSDTNNLISKNSFGHPQFLNLHFNYFNPNIPINPQLNNLNNLNFKNLNNDYINYLKYFYQNSNFNNLNKTNEQGNNNSNQIVSKNNLLNY